MESSKLDDVMFVIKVGSVGVEFGPTLAGWGSGQDRETILQAIIEPSADLAHGYEGTELWSKEINEFRVLFRLKATRSHSCFRR